MKPLSLPGLGRDPLQGLFIEPVSIPVRSIRQCGEPRLVLVSHRSGAGSIWVLWQAEAGLDIWVPLLIRIRAQDPLGRRVVLALLLRRIGKKPLNVPLVGSLVLALVLVGRRAEQFVRRNSTVPRDILAVRREHGRGRWEEPLGGRRGEVALRPFVFLFKKGRADEESLGRRKPDVLVGSGDGRSWSGAEAVPVAVRVLGGLPVGARVPSETLRGRVLLAATRARVRRKRGRRHETVVGGRGRGWRRKPVRTEHPAVLRNQHARVGVLVGAVASAGLAGGVLVVDRGQLHPERVLRALVVGLVGRSVVVAAELVRTLQLLALGQPGTVVVGETDHLTRAGGARNIWRCAGWLGVLHARQLVQQQTFSSAIVVVCRHPGGPRPVVRTSETRGSTLQWITNDFLRWLDEQQEITAIGAVTAIVTVKRNCEIGLEL